MNRSIIHSLSVLLLAITVSVCKADEPVPVRVPFSMPAPVSEGERTKVTVAMRRNIPTVEITINGKGPYRLAVDTGFPGYAIVSERLAEALNLSKTGTMLAGDPSGRDPIQVNRYALKEITLGDIRFKNLTSAALPDSSGRPMIEDGILGLAFFSGHTLTIDYDKLELHLSPDPLPESDGTVFEYSPDPFISIPVTVGTHKQTVHLDTGNGRGALIVPEKVAKSLGTIGIPMNAGVGQTLSNTMNLFKLRLASPVRFGKTILPIQEITYPSVTDFGNLGSLGLRGLILRIDQKNRQVQITSPDQP